MKKEEKERQLAEAARKRAETAKAPEPPPTTHQASQPPSRQVPRVKLVRGSQQEQDILATQALLQAWATPDGYHCPRCPFQTTNQDDFLEHIETEINKAMELIAGMGKR